MQCLVYVFVLLGGVNHSEGWPPRLIFDGPFEEFAHAYIRHKSCDDCLWVYISENCHRFLIEGNEGFPAKSVVFVGNDAIGCQTALVISQFSAEIRVWMVPPLRTSVFRQ